MKGLLIVLFAVSVLASCATSRQVHTADGEKGYLIDCSGSALSWGLCYEKAGMICGEKGYVVLEKSGDQGALVLGNQSGLYGGSIINRSMIIKCKE